MRLLLIPLALAILALTPATSVGADTPTDQRPTHGDQQEQDKGRDDEGQTRGAEEPECE